MNFGLEYHLNHVCGDYNLRRTMEMLGGLSAAREPPSVAFLVAWAVLVMASAFENQSLGGS